MSCAVVGMPRLTQAQARALGLVVSPGPRQRLAVRKRRSKGEETLAEQVSAAKLPRPEREYRFHVERRWRFDFAWPRYMVALEVEGWGRHQRYVGYAADCEKYSAAAELGWRVLRFTTEQVKSGAAIQTLQRVLTGEV